MQSSSGQLLLPDMRKAACNTILLKHNSQACSRLEIRLVRNVKQISTPGVYSIVLAINAQSFLVTQTSATQVRPAK